jgi:transcriptional regulator with XRE-family HTH domain
MKSKQHGFIPSFWGCKMSMRRAFAVTLRALRKAKGMSQDEFSEAMGRHYTSWLENGNSSVTLDKLVAIAAVLKIEPLVMIALCESVRSGQSVQETMKGVLVATTLLSQNGLLEAFQKEVDRAQATEGLSNESRLKLTEEKIEALLQTGLDQKTIAKNLELSPATVSRYCKRIREKNSI